DQRAIMIDPRRSALLPVRAEGDVSDTHRHVIAQWLHGLFMQFRIENRSIEPSGFFDIRHDHSKMLEPRGTQGQLGTCGRRLTSALAEKGHCSTNAAQERTSVQRFSIHMSHFLLPRTTSYAPEHECSDNCDNSKASHLDTPPLPLRSSKRRRRICSFF